MTRSHLDQLSAMLPQNPSETEVLQRVLWLARQLAWSDSAVVFSETRSKLEAKLIRSPYRDELLKERPLGIQEPLLKRALSSDEIVYWDEPDGLGERIFRDENTAIVLPIRSYGFLYLGRRDDEAYEEDTITNLVALCQQAELALKISRLSHSRSSLKQEEAESRRKAESLLKNVSSLVEVMTDILPLHDPAQVLQQTGANLFRFARFGFWAIVAGVGEDDEPDYFFTGIQPGWEVDRKVTLDLARMGARSKRTISLVKMERLSLPRPSEKARSALLCPMIASGETIGCLVLCSARITFSLKERELLSTLALQVGSHFHNLHLHKNLEEAHESLKHSQAQLVQSSKMAAVGQLAAGVAHELNSPLGAINLAIEGALRVLDTKPERATKRLNRALHAGEQLGGIIAKLLYYSTPARGLGESVDVNRLVRDTLELMNQQLTIDEIQVETKLEAEGEILTDHNEMQQVLVNIIGNARDALNESDGSELRLESFNQGDSICLVVSDTGNGMSPEVEERAFEPFFTTKQVGSGTGLGLSVSKELVEKHQGSITLASELGQGTTVRLSFPRES